MRSPHTLHALLSCLRVPSKRSFALHSAHSCWSVQPQASLGVQQYPHPDFQIGQFASINPAPYLNWLKNWLSIPSPIIITHIRARTIRTRSLASFIFVPICVLMA